MAPPTVLSLSVTMLGGAAGEDEGIEAERRLLRRELVLGVLAGERDQRARDGDFVDAVLGERDADGVADAVGQQRADADGALDAAVLAVAGLGDAEVERVIPVGPELEQARGEHAVGVDHHLGVARLHGEDEVVVAVLARDAGELDGALDHAGGRVAEAVHDAVGERAVVGADAHGDAARLAEIDERLEGLVDAGEFLLVLVVGVLADGEFLFVGEVAGIDADFLDPLRGFHGGVGLEVDVGDDGDVAAGGGELGLDVLEIGGVLDGGRGDADDLAADLDEVEGLLDALARVHRVAGEHRLDADGIGPADADLADLDLAGKAALVVVRIVAVGDGRDMTPYSRFESQGQAGSRSRQEEDFPRS